MATELLPGEVILTPEGERDGFRVLASFAVQGELSITSQYRADGDRWVLSDRVVLESGEMHALARILGDLAYGRGP